MEARFSKISSTEEALRKGMIGFPYNLLPGIILKI